MPCVRVAARATASDHDHTRLAPWQDFICPIGGEIMTDPVIAKDGHTYERKHIEEWFRVRLSSPLTNQNLASAELTPNHTLKKVIADFLARSRAPSIPKSRTAQQLVHERDIPELVHERDIPKQELNQICDYVYDHYHSTDEVILVKHVAKVNNPRLQASFDQYKQEIGGRVIRAFHGTLDESAASISQQGFKCPLSNEREDIMQETGLLTFGKAIYFTQYSNLACAFGEATLVVSEVVLGNEWNLTQSRNDLDIHKVRARDKHSVACERTHEFAAYEPRQTLPLYVVTYKLVKPGTQGEAYDRATLAATYSRMVDASSSDWELVPLHLGAQGRPRQVMRGLLSVVLEKHRTTQRQVRGVSVLFHGMISCMSTFRWQYCAACCPTTRLMSVPLVPIPLSECLRGMLRCER